MTYPYWDVVILSATDCKSPYLVQILENAEQKKSHSEPIYAVIQKQPPEVFYKKRIS